MVMESGGPGARDSHDTRRKSSKFTLITARLTKQFNCVKEMSLTETAECFRSANYNVILYDSRGVRGSGGYPRNQIDPWQISQNISD